MTSSDRWGIAGLVAAGHTNRAVAGALFLSEKTVESHLAGAFVRLGVRTRGAVAAALAGPVPEHGLARDAAAG